MISHACADRRGRTQWLYSSAGAKFSVHLSGTENGRMQLAVLPDSTTAVAVARTPCDGDARAPGLKTTGRLVAAESPFR